MFFVIKMALHDIYIRRNSFFLSVLLICIGGLFILSALYDFFFAEYRIITVKDLINDKTVLHITILPNVAGDPQFYENFEKFDSAMTEKYGDRYGKYMYVDACSYSESNSKQTINTLYLDRSCFHLCPLGNYFSETEIASDKSVILVGYNLIEEKTMNSTVYNNVTGETLHVAGILPKGAKWLSGNPFVSDHPMEILDDYAVSLMDDGLFKWDGGVLYGACFTSIYLNPAQSGISDIREDVRELAEHNHISIFSIKSIEEEIDDEYTKRAEWIKAGGDMSVLAFVLCFAACISTGLTDSLCLRREAGIMRICGVSKFCLWGIITIENVFRFFLAGLFTWSVHAYINTQINSVVLLTYALPAYVSLLLSMMLVISILSSCILTGKSELYMVNEVQI